MMIVAVSLLAAAAATLPLAPPLTVTLLKQRHVALEGRTIQVEGRLTECQPLSCGLLGEDDDSGVTNWLSFETAPKFDRSAANAIGHRVVVEGMVLGACWPDQLAICTDRAPQFRPLRVVRDLDSK